MSTIPARPPSLDDLGEAAAEALAVYERVDAARQGWVNSDGGDVAASASTRGLVRHVANYLAAARLVETAGVERVVDVGAGVGALSVWLAGRLDARLTLVDSDPAVRALAIHAFAGLDVRAATTDLADGAAALVTGMEVIEHVAPAEQAAFVAELARLVAPGGMLVLSTPDETRYPGGWSGYAPHIGVLDAEQLTALVAGVTGWPTVVWRLEGEPFALEGLALRVVQRLGNRLWALVDRRVPGVTRRAVGAASGLAARWKRHRGRTIQPRLAGSARAVPAEQGTGTGLLAVATRPDMG